MNEIMCKGKTYEVNDEQLYNIERMMEKAEEEMRERAADRVEERFERMSEEVEERTRRANEHLHGAILDGVVRKALKELRQQLEVEAEASVREDVEQFREHLLQQDAE